MKEVTTLRTLYDVQQLLKQFNVFVYVGKRLWDIELMAIEVDHLYQAGVLDRQRFTQAKLVLKREHRQEEQAPTDQYLEHFRKGIDNHD